MTDFATITAPSGRVANVDRWRAEAFYTFILRWPSEYAGYRVHGLPEKCKSELARNVKQEVAK